MLMELTTYLTFPVKLKLNATKTYKNKGLPRKPVQAKAQAKDLHLFLPLFSLLEQQRQNVDRPHE